MKKTNQLTITAFITSLVALGEKLQTVEFWKQDADARSSQVQNTVSAGDALATTATPAEKEEVASHIRTIRGAVEIGEICLLLHNDPVMAAKDAAGFYKKAEAELTVTA